jgi:hypothetical protein
METFDGLPITATWDNGTLLPYVSAGPLQPTGSGDGKLMAFQVRAFAWRMRPGVSRNERPPPLNPATQHRACLTTNTAPGMKTPFPQPPGYDPAHFTLLQRVLDAVVANGEYPDGPPLSWFTGLQGFSGQVARAGREKYTICCGDSPVSSDQPDLNAGWATANASQRAAMIAAHTYYLQGSLFYMANDPRVPNGTRADTSSYGLCGDEFVQFGNWPPQLYVRESVRLVGDYVMTANELASPRSKPNASVSMAVWVYDKHVVSRIAVPDPTNASRLIAFNEGLMLNVNDPTVPPKAWCRGGPRCPPSSLWYDVPLNITLPKRAEATNLVVPVALSVSSVVFSSTRIETMYMDLGSAAGVVAAAVATGKWAATQDVPVSQVQALLESRYGQRVRGPWW